MMDPSNHTLTLDEPMLTPVQLSKLTCLSVSTLAHYRCSGRGPKYLKLGKRILYRRSDVDGWFNDHTFKSTAEHSTQTLR